MSLENTSAISRKLTFNIAKSDVQASSAPKLNDYAKKAKVQGFRQGKVPRAMVEQMYGATAYEEALNDQINKKFTELVIEHKLQIAGQPTFDLINNGEGEEFVFTAVFDVYPEVKLGDLSAQSVEKLSCTISDEDVTKTIDSLRKQHATYVLHPGKAENGHQVTIDFTGSIDGVLFDGGSATDYPFVLGQGYMLPDFETGVLGMLAGDSKDIVVKFPDSYHATNLAGKNADFKLVLKEVKSAELPELTEEFIVKLGVTGNEAKLRTEVKENLQREVSRRCEVKTRDNALDALFTATPLEVPKSLVHDEVHSMMHHTEQNMKSQGYPADKIKLTHEMFEKDAKRMVALRLLVSELIKEEKLTANDDDAKVIVSEMSHMYDDETEYMTWYFEDKTRVEQARAMAMEKKVTSYILTKTQNKETTISYEDAMKLSV